MNATRNPSRFTPEGWRSITPRIVARGAQELVACAVCNSYIRYQHSSGGGRADLLVLDGESIPLIARPRAGRARATCSQRRPLKIRAPSHVFSGHPAFLRLISCAGVVVALVPAAAIAALFAVRTALEDRMLASQLAGYSRYVERVRYRLLPGIW